jgi:hypothetical protein
VKEEIMSYSELFSSKRSCAGNGVNHENQDFSGALELSPVVNGKGLELKFKAAGIDGTVFHEEFSLLGPGLDGKPCLFVLSNNHPGVTPHNLKKTDRTHDRQQFIFGFGDIADEKSFREEIALTLWNDGSVEYKYSWGLPGGKFAERSGVKMLPR